jgi:hypothetical protein
MGLRDTLTNAAKTAFVATGDIPETAYYYQDTYTSTAYDISTGVVSTTSASPYVVSMIFVQYSQKERESENIEPADMKGLIPQANISAVPAIDDHLYRVEAGASVRYDVIDREQDPAAALWKLQLRKP